ncbi:MAG: hypothetical protein ABFD62_16425 [Syntrophaceae bacterium]
MKAATDKKNAMGASHGVHIPAREGIPQPGLSNLDKSGQEFHFPPPPGQIYQAILFQHRISPLNSCVCYHEKSELVKQSPFEA